MTKLGEGAFLSHGSLNKTHLFQPFECVEGGGTGSISHVLKLGDSKVAFSFKYRDE